MDHSILDFADHAGIDDQSIHRIREKVFRMDLVGRPELRSGLISDGHPLNYSVHDVLLLRLTELSSSLEFTRKHNGTGEARLDLLDRPERDVEDTA